MAINLKNLKNLRKGFKELSPLQLCEGRIASLSGMIIGLILVLSGMIMNDDKSWSWIFFMVFLLMFQLVNIKSEFQQRRALKSMEQSMVDANDELNELMGDLE
jgi:Zn-dependent membrane protease YugP